jgi:hypothetical protein
MQLCIPLQKRECIAKTAIAAIDTDQTIQQQALRLVPHLAQDADVVIRFVQVADLETMKQFLLEQQPQFLDHKEIMLQALQRDPDLLANCSATLRQDADILMAGINKNSAENVLRGLSSEWKIQHPQVTAKAVRVAPLRLLRYVRRNLIPQALWRNSRDLQLAWIQRGQPVLESFAHLVRDDRELALAVAEFSGQEFYRVGDRLRSNWDFMKTAISKNGRVWQFAKGPLVRNMELAVWAIAQHPLALSAYDSTSRQENQNNDDHHPHPPPEKFTMQQVQEHVETTLQLRDTFLNQFLRGIVTKKNNDNNNNHSYLHMLDQGQETGQASKILIAQFLGIPMGEMLSIYKKCRRHLHSQPPHPYETALYTSRRELLNLDDDRDVMLADMDRLQRHQFIQRRRRIMLRMQQRQHEELLLEQQLRLQQDPNINEMFIRGADILDDDDDDAEEGNDHAHPAEKFQQSKQNKNKKKKKMSSFQEIQS